MAHLLLPHHMHAMILLQDSCIVMWMNFFLGHMKLTNQTSHDKEPLTNHNMSTRQLS
jgi:hypothetical protein